MTYTIKDIKIFIPTYNRPGYLRESIKSLVNQSAGVPDITVYNNGVMQETSDVIKEFEQYGVKEVHSKGGLFDCMNSIEKDLDCPYVMIFHDDDILNCKYLEYALRALNKYENVAFITTKVKEFTNPETIDLSPATECHYFFSSQKQFSTYLYLYEYVAMQTAIYRTDLFKKYPRDMEKYGKFCDWPYLVTLSKYGNVVLFNDLNMFNVRRHPAQWTNDKKSSWTVKQLINWHDIFAKAMDINSDKNCVEHMIFYSKFHLFISGGYNGLVCEDFRKECPYDEMLNMAYKQINIDTKDSFYNKLYLIPGFQREMQNFYWRKDFSDKITEPHDIDVRKLMLEAIEDLQNQINYIFYKLDTKKRFIKQVFSLDNYGENYKLVRLFGMKIKFKKK